MISLAFFLATACFLIFLFLHMKKLSKARKDFYSKQVAVAAFTLRCEITAANWQDFRANNPEDAD